MKALTLNKGNPMGMVLVAILFFEAIVFGLAIPVMLMVTEVPAVTAALAGGGAALLALIAGLIFRRSDLGYLLGWLAQLAGIALGFLTSAMFALGGLFGALWVVSFVMGRRIAAQQAGTSARASR